MPTCDYILEKCTDTVLYEVSLSLPQTHFNLCTVPQLLLLMEEQMCSWLSVEVLCVCTDPCTILTSATFLKCTFCLQHKYGFVIKLTDDFPIMCNSHWKEMLTLCTLQHKNDLLILNSTPVNTNIGIYLTNSTPWPRFSVLSSWSVHIF